MIEVIDAEAAVTFLHDHLTSWLMLVIWCIPFVTAVACAWRGKDWRLVIVALICVPFLIYFMWAVTGLWSKHIVALAFNRLLQIFAAFTIVLLVIGLARYDIE